MANASDLRLQLESIAILTRDAVLKNNIDLIKVYMAAFNRIEAEIQGTQFTQEMRKEMDEAIELCHSKVEPRRLT